MGALEAAAEAASARVGAPMAYLTFNRQADGVPVSALGASGKGPHALLPSNDEICAAVAVKAAPLCTLVDNFILSDTYKSVSVVS